MKGFLFFFLLLLASNSFTQSLPINFEGDVTTANFVNFDGGTAIVTDNPQTSGINTSANVGRIVRDGGAIFAGSKILLDNNLDFSVLTKITMKVYTTAPAGTTVKFKLEGAGPATEADALTTVSGQWETLEWVFLGVSNQLNEVVLMFDFGNVGDGSANSTFYFDDIEQIAGPTAPVPATLPIDFESSVVSTDFISYDGASLEVVANPQMNGINTSSTVAQVVKDGGRFFAGSRLFLANNLDFSTRWQISVKVYTTAPVGTRIKLELQGPGGRANLDYLTTTSGEWEVATWNFHGQTNGFNQINFLFDFGNVGDGSANSTFLFDDIEQVTGPEIAAPRAFPLPVDFENSVLTSDFINEDGGIAEIIPNPYVTTDNPSATVGQFVRSGGAPWAKSKLTLTEFLANMSTAGVISMKVYTDAPVGTLLKLKIESNQAGFADERDVFTTVSGGWATYRWDFTNQDIPIYNVITLMLGYATPNDASANATFLFDDIEQTQPLSDGSASFQAVQAGLSSFPNPATRRLTIRSENNTIQSIRLFNMEGKIVATYQAYTSEATIDVSQLPKGFYLAQILTPAGVGSLKLVVE